MAKELRKVNEDQTSGFNIDLSNIGSVVATWNGQKMPGRIPDNVAHDVFYEIFRVSFTQELLMADQYLYEVKPDEHEDKELANELDASSREERNLKVMGAIPGMLDGGDLGFGLSNDSLCQRSLYGLHCVMKGWSWSASMAITSLPLADRLEGPTVLPLDEIDEAEYHIAFHYICSFADFFKRAPVLPHRR
ncbi:hypothetical protein BT96DRAFT_1007519 [Gymnopus androsaceus JB14]|uniref:Uncharacterized protein n=1 Tax=Gymnopus androsaceus JB14 TaxID=1447944 RepID=A0A6A4GH63_9AGAR|nr:hypothetical protein BT96DRAFT_1007519 [Gymnopus androsaceus JB14]